VEVVATDGGHKMNRRGFLKRLAGFVGAAAISPKVIEEVMTAPTEPKVAIVTGCTGGWEMKIASDVTVTLPSSAVGFMATVVNLGETPVTITNRGGYTDTILEQNKSASFVEDGRGWCRLA
jgi:hypothetical protein